MDRLFKKGGWFLIYCTLLCVVDLNLLEALSSFEGLGRFRSELDEFAKFK